MPSLARSRSSRVVNNDSSSNNIGRKGESTTLPRTASTGSIMKNNRKLLQQKLSISTGGRNNAAPTKSGKQRQPPLKRRRILLHHSSTGTSESDEEEEQQESDDEQHQIVSSSYSSSSSCHDDNELDSDYSNNDDDQDDQTTPKAATAKHSVRVGVAKVGGVATNTRSRTNSQTQDQHLEEGDMSMDEYNPEDEEDGYSSSSSIASSSSAPATTRALSTVEANALNRQQLRARGRVTAAGHAKGKSAEQFQKQAARTRRRDVPLLRPLVRFPPSPVKLLPSANNGKRGFQVRPDQPNPFSRDLPNPDNNTYLENSQQSASSSTTTSSNNTARQHRAASARTTASLQAGLRKFAGRMMEKVSNINGSRGGGISGNAKSSGDAHVVTHHITSPAPLLGLSSGSQQSLYTSLNGKRKRDDRRSDYGSGRMSLGRRSSSTSDRKSQKRNQSQESKEQQQQQQQLEADFATFQPLRRTRSLARQIEQLGIPASQAYSDTHGAEDVQNDEAPVASTSGSSSRRRKAQVVETDEDTESVERSIAEMSLDEVTETAGEDEEEEEEEEEHADEEEGDTHFLTEASVPTLHRLRKDRLLRLVALFQHEDDEQDRSEYTKDMLVKMILDHRDEQVEAIDEGDVEEEEIEAEEEDAQSERASSEEEEEEEEQVFGKPQRSVPVLATRFGHGRRASNNIDTSKSSRSPKGHNSVPNSSSPRRRLRRLDGRSKSFNAILDSSSAASSSTDDDDAQDESSSQPSPRQRRRTGSGIGISRPGYGGLMGMDKTPGRLRSGKLRHSSQIISSSDAEKENRFHQHHRGMRRSNSTRTSSPFEQEQSPDELEEDEEEQEEEEDDAPTPIARRTRHRRNMSTVSAASSAGFGDDEDTQEMPNREYRLRKVSVPRRVITPKRLNFVQSSEEEQGEEDEEEEEDLEQADDEEEADEEEEGEEEAEDEESAVENDENDIDFSTATKTSLLRLRRDILVNLCNERELDESGTKSDMVNVLLAWWASQQDAEIDNAEEEEDDQANASVSSEIEEDDVEEEEEDDDDDNDAADASMENLSSDTLAEESASETASSVHSDATARLARKETKTQALARLSNKRQSYDTESQEKPLLLKSPRSRAELIHSPRPDTPPGSGDAQDNDLELDLESLNLLDKEIHPDKLKKGEKIGSGGFKDVYEGRYRNVKVALADIRGHLTENDIKELGLLRDLRHENIVRFIGVSIPTSRDVPVTIVSELCSNGDLFDYIRNTPAPPLEKVLSIMLNIARGLEYLHHRKPATIHRDMKSSNVLITAKGVAKISDFGLARVRNSTRSIIKSLVGTVNWQAPELWVPHPRYNEKVDVYSAAMVFWECLQWHLSQKRYPFEGMNEHAIYQEVGQKQMRPSLATMHRQWGGDIIRLVERMWAQAPAQRPTMSEVVRELESQLATEKARSRAASR